MDRAPSVSGYSEAGASVTRRAMKGFIAASASPNLDIDLNNATLRKRSRLLYMSSPIATAAINTNRTKIVGTGLTLKSAIDREVLGLTPEAAKEWQRKTEAEFAIWAGNRRNCDALGLNNFTALQQLALKSWLMSGDCFVLLKRDVPTPLNPYALRLHLIEADRVSTPEQYCVGATGLLVNGKVKDGEPGAGHDIYDGVEVDENGRVVAYHICNGYPNDVLHKKLEWTRVLATGERTGMQNVLSVMNAERPDQYRGVPYLAQIIEPLLQLRRYTESELMAALVQSFFTAWIETEGINPADMPFDEVGAGDFDGVPSASPQENNVSHSENEYELAPGTVIHLKQGEKVVFGNPNIPTAGFETFVKTICRLIGSALEIPYDVLVKEFNSSYSASRGALLEAWEACRMRRVWFVDDFCQPVYEAWLAEAVARGRIKAPGFFDDPLLRAAWCSARWIGPVQQQLDPKKEVEAAILMVDHGFKTNEQVAREMGGGDWSENVEELARENEQLKAAGGSRVTQIDGGNSGDDGNGTQNQS